MELRVTDDGLGISAEGDGAQALAAVQAFAPDVMLLDIGLPDGSVEDQQRAADAGFDHHLTKPVELETVEALLAAFAQQRRGLPDRAPSPATT